VFHVEVMKPIDFPFAVELSNTMNWHMSTFDFEFNSTLSPDGCFVLYDGSKRIGIATCISYGAVGWFGNLVVKKTCRSKGAGSILVEHAITHLKSRGVATVGLYAYLHLLDFYGRLGFHADSTFAVLSSNNSSSSWSFPSSKFRRIDFDELPLVVDLDRQCFGVSREKLFDALAIVDNPHSYCAIDKEGNLVGFVVAKVGDGIAEVGPLVCRPNSMEAAVTLLKGVLSSLRGFEVYVYVPHVESSLLEAAFKIGFRKEFDLARMFLGPKVARDCVYTAESLERG
jgi:hypothetical protein